LVIKGPWSGQPLWDNGYTRPNIKIDAYAQGERDNEISPFLLVCANRASFDPPTPYTPYTDGAGFAWTPVRWGPVINSKGEFYFNSHGFAGLNAFAYDGSARWVRWREVTWMAFNNQTGHYLSNHYPLGGNFNEWAEKRASVAP
jgi:hypothetical protein